MEAKKRSFPCGKEDRKGGGVKVRQKGQMSFVRPKRREEGILQETSHICFTVECSNSYQTGWWWWEEEGCLKCFKRADLISLISLILMLTSSNWTTDDNPALWGLVTGHQTQGWVRKIPNYKIIRLSQCSCRPLSRWFQTQSWTNACGVRCFNQHDSGFISTGFICDSGFISTQQLCKVPHRHLLNVSREQLFFFFYFRIFTKQQIKKRKCKSYTDKGEITSPVLTPSLWRKKKIFIIHGVWQRRSLLSHLSMKVRNTGAVRWYGGAAGSKERPRLNMSEIKSALLKCFISHLLHHHPVWY